MMCQLLKQITTFRAFADGSKKSTCWDEGHGQRHFLTTSALVIRSCALRHYPFCFGRSGSHKTPGTGASFALFWSWCHCWSRVRDVLLVGRQIHEGLGLLPLCSSLWRPFEPALRRPMAGDLLVRRSLIHQSRLLAELGIQSRAGCLLSLCP